MLKSISCAAGWVAQVTIWLPLFSLPHCFGEMVFFVSNVSPPTVQRSQRCKHRVVQLHFNKDRHRKYFIPRAMTLHMQHVFLAKNYLLSHLVSYISTLHCVLHFTLCILSHFNATWHLLCWFLLYLASDFYSDWFFFIYIFKLIYFIVLYSAFLFKILLNLLYCSHTLPSTSRTPFCLQDCL